MYSSKIISIVLSTAAFVSADVISKTGSGTQSGSYMGYSGNVTETGSVMAVGDLNKAQVAADGTVVANIDHVGQINVAGATQFDAQKIGVGYVV